MRDADYRKINDRSGCSSTYHKKDGTNVRAILKEEARAEVKEGMEKQPTICPSYSEDCRNIINPFKCWMGYPSYAADGTYQPEIPTADGYCPLVKPSKLKV